ASWFLNRLIGQSKAKELMFRSERVGARECERLGLVNRVFNAHTFHDDAQRYAAEIANGPATALRLMKRNLNRGALQGLRESLAMEAQHMILSGQSEDAAEAVRAFMEKRTPEFTFR
ncbi:MAG: enoyl-CoA hydratase-related protein, partial [Gammaproteobacteria bacterium]